MWYFLTILLDVYPYIFLQFMPFKNKTRFGYAKTMLICTVVLLVYFLGFVWFSGVQKSTESLALYRLATLIIIAALTVFLLQDRKTKTLFVFGLIFPYVGFVLSASSALAGMLPFYDAPIFMLSSICRMILAAITFPMMRLLFKKFLIPAMDMQDEGIWKVAWTIPISLTLICAAFVNFGWELYGVPFKDLIGWVVLFICSIVVSVFLFKTLKIAEQKAILTMEKKHHAALLRIQAQQYNAIEENIGATKKAKHDLMHHLNMIRTFSAKKDFDGLNAYIDEYAGSIPAETSTVLCENHAVNAIGEIYTAKAKQYEINLAFDCRLLNNIGINNTDIAIVLGNCLENAVEACQKLPPPARYINVHIRQMEKRISIITENSFDGSAKTMDGHYLSRKLNYQESGLGIASVIAVVKKHCGDISIEQQKNVFKVSILLQTD